MTPATGNSILLSVALPTFYAELERLLKQAKEPELTAQLPGLVVVDRCRCGDDFCASFYTQPKPKGAYGPDLRTLELEPDQGMIILDILNGKIAHVDVLYRVDIRTALLAVLP